MRLLARWAGSFLERQSVLDELSFTKKRFELIFENNASGLMLVDDNYQIIMVNKRFCDIIGFSQAELIGRNASIIHTDETAYETLKENFLTTKNQAYTRVQYQLKRKDNELIYCEFFGSSMEIDEDTIGVIWSILDITEQQKLQKKLQEQAICDYLTELHNKRYFTYRLKEEIYKLKRDTKIKTSLLMFDLDKFKNINDTFGHLTGDIVLKKFADVLKDNLRKTDIAGRVGGEEFAMILQDTTIENALFLANRIKEEVSNTTFKIDEKDISFTVSIGITTLSTDDSNSDDAFARVDEALYRAKANGRNRIEQN